MKHAFGALAIGGVVGTGVAFAAPLPQSLASCVAPLPDAPDLVQETAQNWLRHGGGAEAHECLAQADLALGAYREAAREYEALAAQDVSHASGLPAGNGVAQHGGDRETAYAAQAAGAWLLAGDGIAAERASRRALSVSPAPSDPAKLDLKLLLARSLSMQGHYEAASEALGVLPQTPTHESGPVLVRALVVRGAAFRQLGRNAEGLADVSRALALQPDDIEALLERGILNVRLTRYAQARSDWDRVIALAPDGHEAYLARQDEAVLDSDPDQE